MKKIRVGVQKVGQKARLLALGLATFVAAGAASAQTSGGSGPDLSGLSSVYTGMDSTSVVAAFVAGAAILAVIGFAKMSSKKAGKYFG